MSSAMRVFLPQFIVEMSQELWWIDCLICCIPAFCQPQPGLNMAAPLAVDIFTDLVVAIIPATTILRIQTIFWERVGLSSFGIIAFIICSGSYASSGDGSRGKL
ncbi:hypothetical protein F5B22DRAFT_598767 [Xylaria bambusicola]|uniref:uncharacterized protein n=1 Tax=Xylaria bambusicola TaxID=326684 RepID=UPI00200805E5|nr:uncharacterized protein F5B22DRAFT_598767 [Xylaria bambusicola]KAI0520905.1 hypothetical protein F5B22DRAFT_598767 [Xylaria bambusicola]